MIGQETGLTALSIAATIYFVVIAREPDDLPAMVSAGLAAALCALSREYGWIALIAGAIALLWRRHPLKQVMVFGAVATAAAAPWYIRNWILTGNPFYSLKFLSFAVNPVHDSIMRYYSASLGITHWTGSNWASLLFLLLVFATFQLLAGIPGGFTRFRSHGYLLVIALLLIGVWILSAGYTSGGVLASTRVLSPALVVLSITAAGMLEPLTHRAPWRTAMVIAIAAVCSGPPPKARSIRRTLFPCPPANGSPTHFRTSTSLRNFKSATSWFGSCRQVTACCPTAPICTPP